MYKYISSIRMHTILFFIFLTAQILNAQMPPHEKLIKDMKTGKISKPNFISFPSSAVEKGLDMPWRLMLQKSHGIKIVKEDLSKMSILSTDYKVLVILVRFTDNDSSVSSSAFDQLVFGSSGSTLRNYYNSVSRTSFDIVTVDLPSSTGWKLMPQDYSYYVNGEYGTGSSTAPYSYPNNCQKLAEDAVDAVDDSVDFSQYDNDGDGYVDALMLVHSGPGAEFTGDEDDIWSHSWQMSSPKLHDNVYTYAYTIQPEYWENPGDMTCGVFAHEFGHMAFDLPDLYDRDYSSNGLGRWSLMAGGSWNGPQDLGGSPAFPDAWSRMEMGFADVVNVTLNKINQSIESVQNSSTIYRLWKYGLGGSEYFLVENRQQSGYDTYLPGNGLLIYHIDDNIAHNDDEWYPDHYNDGHYKVALEQADNLFSLERRYNPGDAGDPFPGSYNKEMFSGWSQPNSFDYAFNDTYVDIINISNSSPTMSADLKVGGTQITVDQKLNDNQTRVGTVGRWSGSSFYPRINPGTIVQVKEYETETFQGDQALYSNQKYNNWNNDKTDVKNHHEFILNGYIGIISKFEPTYMGVTIRNALEGTSSTEGGNVLFKDPWFIDYVDPTYGNQLRNRGTSAVFMSRPSPFIPNTNYFEYGRKYNGVFLNESGPPQWNPPYYSVRSMSTQDIYLSHTNKTHKFYFQNWSASGATVQISNSAETPVVFTSSNAIVSTNLKGTQLSNTSGAYSNNSQRKFVRTHDGWLHQVYESMGRVWLEHSSDNGSTWFLGNNGQPLDDVEGKCPSIDWWYKPSIGGFPEYNDIVIVFQQKEDTHYSIRYAIFEKQNNGNYIKRSLQGGNRIYEPTNENYTSSANPNITVGGNGDSETQYFVLTFEKKNASDAGIYWIYGQINCAGVGVVTSVSPYFNYGAPYCSGPNKITGTNANSRNATVNLNKYLTYIYTGNFDVVYEQYVSSSSRSIKDAWLYCYHSGGSWQNQQTGLYTLSSSTGVVNYKPSMIQMPDCNIKVCWIRNLYGQSSMPYWINAVYYNSASSQYNIYGMFVRSISLNESNDNNKTLFTWSQDLYGWENYLSNGSSYTKLSTTGQDVQMSNGTTAGTNMMVSSFKRTSAPYYFTNTSNIGGMLSKSSNTEINYGRGVVLNKDDMHFSYSIKSLAVDGHSIEFIEIPAGKDTTAQRRGVQYLSLDSLNTYLLSEPFTIQKGTSINFSEGSEYYTIAAEDSASEKQIKKNFKVDCKLELIEESTNKSLGTVKQFEYSSDDKNNSPIKSSNLQISNDEAKKVRLKITLKSNVKDVKGVWVNEYNTINTDMLAKLAVEQVTLQEPEIPAAYDLAQNYPNPFNPVTKIQYNLPEDTQVSLVVYNVNGQKVRELVNGFKPAGSYTVTFDAKGLASGVYFYKIQAGKFTNVKRMLLIK